MFGMSFACLKCKMLFLDSVGLRLNLVFVGEQLGEVALFTFLDRCISPDGPTSDEIWSYLWEI